MLSIKISAGTSICEGDMSEIVENAEMENIDEVTKKQHNNFNTTPYTFRSRKSD